ncbi:hypothetical protein UFOVP961_126 [uncultured Caudovirales phage]|uniref:Uncharacterized protein n=1 Tax=uncultured Caudovirales phage TaxID=2100421 RepID=A0A6J5PVE0_9CAUD|nr:hypothetical protein UFOVP961_126 [uncultured Caudovirales phage]CAB4185338.1 hypothetical protein UFOVP1123_54 [uncultured Caudovirales phage]CAB4193514.1 hypothetical protein UFOVP1239_96 [uncultured Caudovirales phage]CAB4216007.1 hypothetical protein UFOVP1484_58 [uncultured Caudovirales phage]CAB5230700.1 hypothetical protein UFOVP1577_64 [uncultured Caudovirales phage]
MASAPNLSLKSLLVPSKSVEVDYPGLNGFKVNVVFLSRETLVGIRKKATKTTFKNRQSSEELDDKLFLQLYVNACIKGWSGLKLSYLEQLAPVDLTGQDMDADLPYDQDNALFLMQSSANFDAFISETVTELSNFTKTSTSN